jgi:hypothetical protein
MNPTRTTHSDGKESRYLFNLVLVAEGSKLVQEGELRQSRTTSSNGKKSGYLLDLVLVAEISKLVQ